MSVYDGGTLAKAWLSVAVASTKNEDNPVLNRTVLVEQHTGGVRLVATDSTVLLHAWAPDIAHAYDTEPEIEEAPIAVAVAIDEHGRGIGLLRHLLALAADKDAKDPEVRLTVGTILPVPDAPGGTMSLDGMVSPFVVIDHADSERVMLPVYESEYPNWRSLLAKFDGKTTLAVAISADMLSRLGKLAKIQKGSVVRWVFGGAEKMALIEVSNADVPVYGAAMPIRLGPNE